MKLEEFKEKINQLDELRIEIKSNLKELMLNDEIDIDERYNALIKSGLGGKDFRTNFGLDRDDDFLYEGPCFMSKYEEWNVEEILESLLEDEDFNMTEDEVQIFKRYCVKNCISSMKFDW